MTLHPDMSHIRCSELLGPLVRGDLAPAEEAAVEAHLTGCPDCAGELKAVRSLLESSAPPMDDLERARLRSGISAGLSQGVPVEEAHPSRAGDGATQTARSASSRRLVRPGAWLGAAAATVILFAGAVAYLSSGGFVAGGSDQGEAAGSAESANQGGGAARPGSADNRAPSLPDGARGPLAVPGRTGFTERSLAALGRKAPTFRAFEGVYGADDVRPLQRRYGRTLEAALGGAQVEPCLTQAIRARPEAIPAYGALGALERRRVLVLGFFIPGSDDRGGRYEVHWWDAGSLGGPCPRPLGSARGAI